MGGGYHQEPHPQAARNVADAIPRASRNENVQSEPPDVQLASHPTALAQVLCPGRFVSLLANGRRAVLGSRR